ncbi:tetratricopeptide repeat protein [Glycomyces xiaoerkulensis]|uniref:tetratricopeptide repeat protein n=1 Tax=Glycomyces xiaoerkulensis TaxID=2038139 RepID=UPI000C25FFCC|nr:tetratricopeptide repeat protein [Glycomyces xiaoerkulensis]
MPDPQLTAWIADSQGFNVGDFGTVNLQAAPRQAIKFPHRVGVAAHLPEGRVARLFEAGAVEAFSDPTRPAPVYVLTGMGGVGKSQSATAIAEQLWAAEQLGLLVWVTASTRSGIIAAFAQAAIDVTRIEDPDPEQAAHRFLAWLARPDAPRWLIVLDDLADPSNLNGLWPPKSERGYTLITTRRREPALDVPGRICIEVDVFTPSESRSFLQTRLARHPELADDLDGVAEDTGHLPLALAQAAAFMAEQDLPCSAYRRLMADQRIRLDQVVPELGNLPDEHTATIAAIWAVSIEAANEQRPKGLAGSLIQVASLLDPNAIPETLLTHPTIGAHLASYRSYTENTDDLESAVSPEQLRQTLRVLHRFSLLNHSRRQVRIHALVQRAVRDQLRVDERHALARAAADALAETWPHPENDPAFSATLRSNVDHLRHSAEQGLFECNAHDVLFRTGNSLGELGQVGEAARYFEQLHNACERTFGPDHRDTHSARSFLAIWRGRSGDIPGAITILENLLTDQIRDLGPDHISTFITRHNLAVWRGQSGDAAGAAAALGSLLSDRLQVLGPHHPDILVTAHDLAHWRAKTGDTAGAASVFCKVLAVCQRTLGPDDPRTLVTRDNLASLQGQAGDAAGAAQAYKRLLADRLEILGPDHPDTLATRGHLASWLGQSGNAAEAAVRHEELLADRSLILGPDHPDILTSRHNLAHWKGKAGDEVGAADEYEILLEECVRILGPDHPHTFVTWGHLATWRGEVGDAVGAAAAFKSLLDKMEPIFGLRHPDTLTTRNNLAHWQGEAGDAIGAAAAFETLLADAVQVWGRKHPNIDAIRTSLDHWKERAARQRRGQ